MQLKARLQKAVDAHIHGRLDQADPLYRKVLAEDPSNVVALHYLGVLLYQRGNHVGAERLIRQALALYPASGEIFGNLGLVLGASGRPMEAIEAYQKAIELSPQNGDHYNNLSSVLLDLGRIDEAIEVCQKAIAIKPTLPFAHYNLGVGLQIKARDEEAVAAFLKAIELKPDFPEAYCNLGSSYLELKRREDSIASFRKAIELRPVFPEAYNNLGRPLSELRMMDEAIDAYSKAVEQKPDYISAVGNLAVILRQEGRLEEALAAYEKGFALCPNDTKAEIEIVGLRNRVCSWKTFEQDSRRLRELAEHVQPFMFLNVSSSPEEQLLCSRRWASSITRGVPFNHNRSRAPGPIRIGYLSADYRRHATAYLVSELLERHDRSRFEIFGYSCGFDDGSDERRRIVKAFDHFVDFYSIQNKPAAQRIYDDQIDILIDLKGYTGDSRTDILVNRPAPVQVNYLGYPGTMGADFIDYIIADSFVVPPEHRPFFSENIVYLPHCYQPNDTTRQLADRVILREECGLPPEGFVFCCFNGPYKIKPPFFDIWMRLLKATPGSVLWLLATTPLIENNFRQEAASRGVDPQRLVFAQGMALPLHLARHKLADLFLDTLPICAHTTASDSLWAGLPILTCVGDSFVGRVAGSLLKTMGLPELMASSLADYEAKALDLAANPQKLAALKRKIEVQKGACPLFDIASYTRHIESAYTRMFETRVAGQPPQPFSVAP